MNVPIDSINERTKNGSDVITPEVVMYTGNDMLLYLLTGHNGAAFPSSVFTSNALKAFGVASLRTKDGVLTDECFMGIRLHVYAPYTGIRRWSML